MLPAAEAPAKDEANVPWKIRETVRPQFPAQLLHRGIARGQARVRVSLSETGALLDALVVACSHRDFGDEALRVVRAWRFEPERVNGAPIGVVAEVAFEFVTSGPVVVAQRAPAAWQEESARDTGPDGFAAAGLKTLDRIPEPAKVVPPVFPAEWRARGITGSATIEFYIDEAGRVRIPLALAATHPELGASAIAAVVQWQFQPPTRGGKPILARAEQVFRFD